MDFRPRHPHEGDLRGPWRVHPMNLQLKRTGADADLDDSDWQPIEVPGHWGQADALDGHDGPLLYRRRFEHRPPTDDERLWLRFDGVLSGAEIWLDGVYTGDTSAYFATNRFDVTDQLRTGGPHLLAVEVSCPDQDGNQPKSSLTGALQTGHLAPTGNPGGIWRPVAVDSTGPVAIRHGRLLCTSAEPDRAEVLIRLVLDVQASTEIRIDTSIVGPDGAAGGGGETHTLASGENRIEWTVPIDGPRLWWPAALGEQPHYDVAVAVRLGDGELSDRRDWRTGLRTVSADDFVWRVNGERLFVKGIVAGPAGRFLNSVTPERLRQDMQAARDAELDLVRVYGHVARPELYEEADRLGLLIWQDLPMVGRYSSKVRSAARAMSRALVDHLGHHPSVGLWCGHCEPNGRRWPAPPPNGGPAARADDPRSAEPGSNGSSKGDGDDDGDDDGFGATDNLGATVGQDATSVEPKAESTLDRWPSITALRQVGADLLPSWNRSVLDPIVARELRNADRTRTVLSRSGAPPGPADPAGSDAHLWLGWRSGSIDNLPRLLRRWPRLGTFLGGIGTQSVVIADWDRHAPRWPGAEAGSFSRYLPRPAYGDGRGWAAATQAYQADVLRAHIEAIRRLKYRPAGGFAVSALADVGPEGGYGVVQADRAQKPAYNVLVDACRPVIVVCDPPPAIVVAGDIVTLAVHAVSDLRDPLEGVRVTGRAHGPSWSSQQVWEGDIPADTCQWIGTLEFQVPHSPAQLHIDLELVCGALVATNRYTTVVIPRSEAMV